MNMKRDDITNLSREIGPALYRFFLARMRPALAEEGVQEVFLRLLANLTYCADKGNLQAFVWGIALNVQRELSRKNPVATETQLKNAEEPAVQVDEDRSFAALREAICRLEEPARVVFQLLLADLSIKEIGGQLDMPEGTVKSHIHRGKEEIKLTMRKWGYS